jgi:hypothetical protein
MRCAEASWDWAAGRELCDQVLPLHMMGVDRWVTSSFLEMATRISVQNQRWCSPLVQIQGSKLESSLEGGKGLRLSQVYEV